MGSWTLSLDRTENLEQWILEEGATIQQSIMTSGMQSCRGRQECVNWWKKYSGT